MTLLAFLQPQTINLAGDHDGLNRLKVVLLYRISGIMMKNSPQKSRSGTCPVDSGAGL